MGPFYSLASPYFFSIGLPSDERCHYGPVRHEGKVSLETLWQARPRARELSEESLRGAGTLNRSSSMTDGTSNRFEILSIALQLIHGATEV